MRFADVSLLRVGGDGDLDGEDNVLARRIALQSRSRLRLDFFLYFVTGGGWLD